MDLLLNFIKYFSGVPLWECTEVSSRVQRWVWSDLQLWQTVQKSSCPELLICQGRKIISYKPFKKNFIPGKEVQKSPWKKVWEGVLWQVQGASKEGRREGHQEEMCLAQEKASRWSQLLEKIKLCFYCWNILFNKIKLRLCMDHKTIHQSIMTKQSNYPMTLIISALIAEAGDHWAEQNYSLLSKHHYT